MLVFEERGKPEYPEKNLSEQSREPTTNSTHIGSGNRTRDTLVGGERSHHCAIPAPLAVVEGLDDKDALLWNSTCPEVAP